MTEYPTPLQRVELAASEFESSDIALGKAIIAAREAGLSLRAIAKAAGLSYETVRRICAS